LRALLLALALAACAPAPSSPEPAAGASALPWSYLAEAPSPEPTDPLAGLRRSGVIAFAEESYGPRYLAVPVGPGHLVRVCGTTECVTLVSTDAGPDSRMIAEGRVADLALGLFARACGWTVEEARLFGLCQGSWEVLP